ncbi:hypothetical protein OLP56_05840 [Campylobacter jejuni]|nr:hypothetical protein [Campylobacter jejuni]
MYNFSKDCILLVLTNTYYDEKSIFMIISIFVN